MSENRSILGNEGTLLLEKWLVPAIAGCMLLLYFISLDVYIWLLLEDSPLEWLTVVCMVGASIAAFRIFQKVAERPRKLFFIFVSVGLFLSALEEISWGQRLIGVASPEFFITHSDQQEINIHNVLQRVLNFKTRHVAGIVLFLYGVLLPVLAYFSSAVSDTCSRVGLLVPPMTMLSGWTIGALLVLIDQPTGMEEEIGEFLFSVCFVLLMADALKNTDRQTRKHT